MLARAWLLQALALEALEALEQQLAWLLGSCQRKPGRSSASTSASTLSGSAHDSFALIPYLSPSEPCLRRCGKQRRQLLRRTQPQRLADGFHLRENLRHRTTSFRHKRRTRASAHAFLHPFLASLRKGQLNRHTRYRPATTTRNTATQRSQVCDKGQLCVKLNASSVPNSTVLPPYLGIPKNK